MPKENDKKEAKKSGSSSSYSADAITVLEGLEPVRKRPGMYIGTTGPDGFHHLITEIFDNSRDEAMGGFANDIEIMLLPPLKGSGGKAGAVGAKGKNGDDAGGLERIRVVDNGRGIPVDIHKQTKVSALETIMTTLHAGGKFGGEGYKVSGGLHGVGASVVNALSSYCKVEVCRDGGKYVQEYSQGKRKAAVKKVGASKLRGTIVTFEPDSVIFGAQKFDFSRVVGHMRQQAYLVKGLRISLIDARGVGQAGGADPKSLDALEEALDDTFYARDLGLEVPSQTFYFEGGLLSFVRFNNQLLKPIHKNIFYVDKAAEGVEGVEIALQYVDDISARILPFANNIYNGEGGTHLTGFKTALTRTLNTYARKNNLVKESEDNFTGEDVLEGLTAVISIKMREIQFEGQTKAKLGSVEAQSATATVFGEAFSAFLEENPDDARAIVMKVVLALKARKAAKAAKDSVLRKGALEGMTLPGKLADCQSHDASESELFIVEGDSAGGCFDGDTKVALADGRNVSFKELIKEDRLGKKNFCYTVQADGHVGIGEIRHPRLTKHSTQTIKIILDNKEEIVCTPDHRFMLRNGVYKEAQQLTPKDSLMPLYRKFSKLGGALTIDGYEMVWDQKRQWIFTHMLAAAFNLDRNVYSKETGTTRHHIDFNKLNNNPTNIVRLSKEAHLKLHNEALSMTLHRPDVKEKVKLLHKTPAFRAKMRKWANQPEVKVALSERAKKQWNDADYKEYMTEKFKAFYFTNEKYRRENNQRLNDGQKKYWSEAKNKEQASKRVKGFFNEYPEQKKWLAAFAENQWHDQNLLAWRKAKTAEQWTPEFRQKRQKALQKTYFDKTIGFMKEVLEQDGSLDRFDLLRNEKRDHSILSMAEFTNRYFAGNAVQVTEAVQHSNHKIKKIEKCSGNRDVYDIEVPDTHNFALASGVFVHNSGKAGRDRRIQAILPLRGKILNIERARLDRMLASEQIKNLVVALGTAIGDTFDISKLRYHKVILATDADVDGAHIRTLILTLLYRYFKPIIDGGYVYIAQPPLYKIKKGKEILYFYNEEEKTKYLGKKLSDLDMVESSEEGAEEDAGALDEAETEGSEDDGEKNDGKSDGKGDKNKKTPKISIQRYKGLGEMNPEELWETTMDPARRILKQVKIEDASEADKIFDMLMGTDVPARKTFIQSNAKAANIDW